MTIVMRKSFTRFFSKSLSKAIVIVALFALSLAVLPGQQAKPAHATAQDDLNSVNAQIDATNKDIEAKKSQVQTLGDAINSLNGQIQQVELQIQATEDKIEITKNKITEAEQELKIQKEMLNEYLRVIYEESNVSTLELIASSNSFSDFVDQTEYLQTIQLKVKTTVEQIKQMKADLEQKKAEAEGLKKNLDSQRADLNNKRSAQATLLEVTKGQQVELEKAATGLKTKRGALYCQIYGGCGGDVNGNLIVQNTGIYYSQKQSPWGPKEYTPGYTMWEYGCLITSYAMVRSMLGAPTDPWQEAMNHSYDGNGEMNNGNAPPGEHVLGTGMGNINWNGVNMDLDYGKPVIVQYNWSHFIVLTGHSGNTYYVNDPYFSVGTKYASGKITKALGY